MTNKELIDLCNERWDRIREIYPENPCLDCEYGVNVIHFGSNIETRLIKSNMADYTRMKKFQIKLEKDGSEKTNRGSKKYLTL